MDANSAFVAGDFRLERPVGTQTSPCHLHRQYASARCSKIDPLLWYLLLASSQKTKRPDVIGTTYRRLGRYHNKHL